MHELVLEVAAEAVDALGDLLSDAHEALSVSIADADAGTAWEEPVFDEPGLSSQPWSRARVSALFADEAAAVAAAAHVLAAAATLATSARVVSIAGIDEQDWVRATQAQFTPVEIAAGFWIVPTWAAVPAGAARVIRLDPGLAFGTGSHPTTRMCLRWIARRATGTPAPGRVLDYGCGSGVLAIAAALHGSAVVEAVDIDAAAVATTRANAAANGTVVRAGGVELAAGRYDLVVANILATPLKLLAPLLTSHVEAGGALLLAGILERQAEELKAAYAPWLPIAVLADDDGWILMGGERPPAGPMA